MLLYQHDLEKTNIGMHNCLFVDFKKLFEEGFQTRNGDIRTPTSFSTAC
jgi:anaerobic ribonucleoside-triphosphate reductase